MSKEDNLQFSLAQTLHESYCDRRGEPGHKCVGAITIKQGKVELNCSVCGSGEQTNPALDTAVAKILAPTFLAAGVDWDSLDLSAQLRAITVYKRTRELR